MGADAAVVKGVDTSTMAQAASTMSWLPKKVLARIHDRCGSTLPAITVPVARSHRLIAAHLAHGIWDSRLAGRNVPAICLERDRECRRQSVADMVHVEPHVCSFVRPESVTTRSIRLGNLELR